MRVIRPPEMALRVFLFLRVGENSRHFQRPYRKYRKLVRPYICSYELICGIMSSDTCDVVFNFRFSDRTANRVAFSRENITTYFSFRRALSLPFFVNTQTRTKHSATHTLSLSSHTPCIFLLGFFISWQNGIYPILNIGCAFLCVCVCNNMRVGYYFSMCVGRKMYERWAMSDDASLKTFFDYHTIVNSHEIFREYKHIL